MMGPPPLGSLGFLFWDIHFEEGFSLFFFVFNYPCAESGMHAGKVQRMSHLQEHPNIQLICCVSVL